MQFLNESKTTCKHFILTENQAQISTAWIGLQFSSVYNRLAWSVDQTAVST